MNRAKQITAVNHTANRIRREAQKACAGTVHEHRADRLTFTFTDGSAIVVHGQRVQVMDVLA